MKILVTGAFGFIGGRLSHFLQQSGYDIFVGTSRKTNNDLIVRGFTKVYTKLDSFSDLKSICKGMDVIVHLAGMNAQDSLSHPVEALISNGANTGRLLQAASEMGVKKIIYFSTAHVYKSPLYGFISEDTPPCSLHPYATSHRAGEDLIRAAHSRGEIQGVVIRLSNAFGSPIYKSSNCWMLLVNDLCKQAVVSKKLKLTSNGLQRRDFITMTDVVRCVEHLINYELDFADEGVFNVGGKWSPTVWEMANFIRENASSVLGYNVELERIDPLSDASSLSLEYSIDKLLQTGFSLTSNKEDEIAKLITFCKNSF